jgi:hypothetical protein
LGGRTDQRREDHPFKIGKPQDAGPEEDHELPATFQQFERLFDAVTQQG